VVNPVTLGGMTVPLRVIGAVIAFMLAYGATLVGLTMADAGQRAGRGDRGSPHHRLPEQHRPRHGQGRPGGNYGVLTDFQIWVCSLAMMLGRLELLSVLVLFTPQFWRG
jgi:trk system potassium uptake protein TrkH